MFRVPFGGGQIQTDPFCIYSHVIVFLFHHIYAILHHVLYYLYLWGVLMARATISCRIRGTKSW